MTLFRNAVFATVSGFVVSTLAYAQTPQPAAPGSENPNAASSPHQREATGNNPAEAQTGAGADASDAASPHQREAMKGDNMASADKAGAALSPASFVQKAGQDGMTEVELAKLALDKSKNNSVRQFASRMQQDHGKANTELMSIAAKKSIPTPKQLDSEHQAMVQDLSAKSGADFDAAYADHMTAAHSKAIALFKAGSKSTDADIAGFAKKTLPTLEEHKKMADTLEAGTKTASTNAGETSKQ